MYYGICASRELEFPEGCGGGGGALEKIPSVGGVWIFSGTTQYNFTVYYANGRYLVFYLLIRMMCFGEGARLQAYRLSHLIKILLEKGKLVGSTLYLHRMNIPCL